MATSWEYGDTDRVIHESMVLDQRYGAWEDAVFADLEPVAIPADTGPTAPSSAAFTENLMLPVYPGNSLRRLTWLYHVPHGFKKGSTPTLHLHMAHKIASPSGTVRWKATWYVARGYGLDLIPTVGTVGSGTFTPEAQYAHSIWGDDDLPCPAGFLSLLEPDTFVMIVLERDVSHAEDTFNNDIYMWRPDMHIELERDGTSERNRPWTSAGY